MEVRIVLAQIAEILTFGTNFFTKNSWPLTVLILAFSFRNQIRNALARLKKATPAGLELYEQQNVLTSSIENSSNLKGVKVSGSEITATYSDGRRKNHIVIDFEKSIIEDLPKYPEDKHQILLISEIAIARSFIIFERIYRDIFGSQIDILMQVSSNSNTISVALAENEFQKIVSKHPDFYQLDQFNVWLRFLETSSLLRRDQEKKSIEITDFGLDFLNYLDVRNYPKEKSF